MSIVFNKIRWKNFLSTGDNFTEIDLLSSSSTLVVGANGAGKSTMLDALAYGLFGKPHRNINKPQLINSINEKNMVVEVEFKIGANNFKVVRGQKPALFEIYKNDQLINQAASVRDYQSHLETTILRLNYKSFHQVVVLGSSSFIPFMQLPTGQRREIIESLLDINIFTKMNQILREEHSIVRESMRSTESSLEVIREKIKVQKKYIKDLQEVNSDLIAEKQKEVVQYSDDYDILEERTTKLSSKVKLATEEYRRRLDSLQSRNKEITNELNSVKGNIKHSKQNIKFFSQNDACPICTQPVSTELSEQQIEKHQCDVDTHATMQNDLEQQLASVSQRTDELAKIFDKIEEDRSRVQEYEHDMKGIVRFINTLNRDIANLQEKSGDIDHATGDLNSLKDEEAQKIADRIEFTEQMNYNALKFEMLKDTGIKTKIIRKYRPIINQLINQYLQVLDFFVQFTLDENFKEVIKSRHRDDFSYSSFSEGEKARIDLALLFTWRQIAAMKNSMKTNLLILDETFDSSLDVDGVDNLLKILDTLEEGTNTFVISHKRDILDSKFPNKLVFKKSGNFSVCEKD